MKVHRIACLQVRKLLKASFWIALDFPSLHHQVCGMSRSFIVLYCIAVYQDMLCADTSQGLFLGISPPSTGEAVKRKMGKEVDAGMIRWFWGIPRFRAAFWNPELGLQSVGAHLIGFPPFSVPLLWGQALLARHFAAEPLCSNDQNPPSTP